MGPNGLAGSRSSAEQNLEVAKAAAKQSKAGILRVATPVVMIVALERHVKPIYRNHRYCTANRFHCSNWFDLSLQLDLGKPIPAPKVAQAVRLPT
jgi:hypothetical protein